MKIYKRLRILCLTDYECCYLSHSLLVGLHETGHEIYELPMLKSIRGGVDEGYILADGNRGYSATPGYLTPNPIPTYQREELTPDLVRSMDLIVMLSGRNYARQAHATITNMLGHKPEAIVCIEGEDYEWIDRNLLNDINPRVFFKRELSKDYSLAAYCGALGRPIYPLPFAAFTRSYPELDDTIKDRDFYLSLGDTHQLRRDLVKSLLEAQDEIRQFRELTTRVCCNSEDPEIKGRAHPLSPWKEYIEQQAHARVTAVIRGYGSDTLHCWEAFSFATLVIYYEPKIYIPYPFKDGVHCLTLEEGQHDKAVPLIRRYVKELKNTGQHIANQGKAHCREYHGTKARAEYLIDISMRVLGGERVEYEEFGL